MKETLSKEQIKHLLFHGSHQPEGKREITSFDEIPDFDTPENELLFWKAHTLSQELLDQIPDMEEDEE